MEFKLRKSLLFLLILVFILFSFAGCKKQEATDIIAEKGLTTETDLSEWSMEIVYISETRGTGEKIYTTLGGDSNEFIAIINSIYASSRAEKPSYIFSAEAMCEYKIDLFHTDKENPEMTFYYLKGTDHNLLTYVTKTLKDEDVYIDYQFFTPYGDLPTMLDDNRNAAYVPEDELAISFVSRIEMMSTILNEELEYVRPEIEMEDNEKDNTDIPFEFYEGEIPDDKTTNSQLYSNRTVPALLSNQYLITAHVTNEKGISEEWSITEVRYNDYFTLVFIMEPDFTTLESLGLTPSSAIIIDKEDLALDKWIVFLDSENNDEVVDVIDPSIEMN